ncbi:hypothetical protein RvY_08367 [Ramazzottius varieornatus]|uniref:Sorting nexin n=1 Tax=Ramazzottius varieornatus TaxID=947166 RepID=A0A1D1VDP9_RAMVA|nr:hypothetical protein RvY_08367 [Ramazzottius varieornatus]
MTSKARALYTFDGQPGTGELSIFENETLTVTRKDVGEGWWEGVNGRGETGLFPAAYVEEIQEVSSPPPSAPAPALYPSIPAQSSYSEPSSQSSWGTTTTSAAAAPVAAAHHEPAQQQQGADWDDEWDDDSDNEQEQEKPRGGAAAAAGGANNDRRQLDTFSSASTMGGSQALSVGGNQASVKGNLNRFSEFVKSGTEDYLLGKLKANVPNGAYVVITDSNYGPMWQMNGQPYTCEIFSPKKESKLKGLKTFIAYQLVPSMTNITVSRRYKHFDWLHERLKEKFVLIPIPPLPDKQVTGRYEDDFIEHRMAQLKLWVHYLCRHPVLSQSEVWQHFLNCTDEKRWKVGKRAAEKDELIGGGFLLATKTPPKPIATDVDMEMNAFGTFTKAMSNAVSLVHGSALENAKRHMGPFKREYEKMGQAFRTLGQAFELDPIKFSSGLTEAIKTTGDTYDAIGKLFEEQPRHDIDPMMDTLHIYRGLLASFPEILDIQKRSSQKLRESEKLNESNRLSNAELGQLRSRADVVSYSVMAEINQFHQVRTENFKTMMEHYLEEQIKFYSTIVDSLKTSLNAYRDIN